MGSMEASVTAAHKDMLKPMLQALQERRQKTSSSRLKKKEPYPRNLFILN